MLRLSRVMAEAADVLIVEREARLYGLTVKLSRRRIEGLKRILVHLGTEEDAVNLRKFLYAGTLFGSPPPRRVSLVREVVRLEENPELYEKLRKRALKLLRLAIELQLSNTQIPVEELETVNAFLEGRLVWSE